MRRREEIGNRDPQRHIAVTRIVGYRPTCKCNAGQPTPCLVLDPFAGSGTTLQTARALGRRWLGYEMSEEYVKLAEKRIYQTPRSAQHSAPKPTPKFDDRQQSLFEELTP